MHKRCVEVNCIFLFPLFFVRSLIPFSTLVDGRRHHRLCIVDVVHFHFHSQGSLWRNNGKMLIVCTLFFKCVLDGQGFHHSVTQSLKCISNWKPLTYLCFSFLSFPLLFILLSLSPPKACYVRCDWSWILTLHKWYVQKCYFRCVYAWSALLLLLLLSLLLSLLHRATMMITCTGLTIETCNH